MQVSFVKESTSKITVEFTALEAERVAYLLADYIQHGTNPFVMWLAEDLKKELLQSVSTFRRNELREKKKLDSVDILVDKSVHSF